MVFTRRTDAYFIHSKTTARGVEFLHNIQQPEGGWPGYWGICFTYATMFALQSLCLADETYETSDSVRRACDYLVSKQRADGGWGESYKVCDFSTLKTIRTRLSFSVQSCEECVWVEHKNTQVVQTSWAAMALMYGKYPYAGPIVKAVKLVMSRQLPVCGFNISASTQPSLCPSSRTARGHKRPSKGSSVGLVRFHIRTSSLLLLSGCLGRHINSWKSAVLFHCKVRLLLAPKMIHLDRCPR
jgi:Squalene-hopene cyclase C-terminal domain